MSKTMRKIVFGWDEIFGEIEIADGVKYGHDAGRFCEHCRSDRMNKRNSEAVKFGGRSVRCVCEKIRLVRLRQ